jgi:hypothetical protein
MENVGLKGLFVTLYQRVVRSYKTTLLGLGVLALGVIVENLVHSPNKIIATVAGVVAAVLALVKEKLPPPPLAPVS